MLAMLRATGHVDQPVLRTLTMVWLIYDTIVPETHPFPPFLWPKHVVLPLCIWSIAMALFYSLACITGHQHGLEYYSYRRAELE